MTLYAFVKLDRNKRMRLVNEKGSFITNDPTTHSNFYVVDDFFVEVRLDDDNKAIDGVMPFKTGERYERMIDRINLARLG